MLECIKNCHIKQNIYYGKGLKYSFPSLSNYMTNKKIYGKRKIKKREKNKNKHKERIETRHRTKGIRNRVERKLRREKIFSFYFDFIIYVKRNPRTVPLLFTLRVTISRLGCSVSHYKARLATVQSAETSEKIGREI